jgi:hypothetical protein
MLEKMLLKFSEDKERELPCMFAEQAGLEVMLWTCV